MRHGNGFRTAAAVLGLGTVIAIVSVGVASATSDTASATCTRYVVTAPAAVEVWIDPEPTGWYEIWNKWPRGHVFCAYGMNASDTRFQVQYYCHPAQNCDPVGPWTGWVTADPRYVAPLNCTAHTLTRSATVWTFPTGDEAWMTWPSGTSFCDFGTDASGSRYQVYVYCSLPACHRPEGTFVGWVNTDPLYYSPPRTSPPCRPWIGCPLPTAEA